MAEFRAVSTFSTPFNTIRNSLKTIRGSPFADIQKAAREELVKAQKEVMVFLEKLEPDMLIRVLPYKNGTADNGTRFLTGRFVCFSVEADTREIGFLLKPEGGDVLCKGELLIEKISQIEIWERKG